MEENKRYLVTVEIVEEAANEGEAKAVAEEDIEQFISHSELRMNAVEIGDMDVFSNERMYALEQLENHLQATGNKLTWEQKERAIQGIEAYLQHAVGEVVEEAVDGALAKEAK